MIFVYARALEGEVPIERRCSETITPSDNCSELTIFPAKKLIPLTGSPVTGRRAAADAHKTRGKRTAPSIPTSPCHSILTTTPTTIIKHPIKYAPTVPVQTFTVIPYRGH